MRTASRLPLVRALSTAFGLCADKLSISTVAPGWRRRNSGISTACKKARNTRVVVAAWMLMAAIMPALESAPRTVSRRQPPGAEPCALSPRAGIERGHRRGNAALVEEDQVLGVELPHPFAEDRPLRLDVGALALAGAQRLFCAIARAAAGPGTGSAG